MTEREKDVLELRRIGWTLQQIAEKYDTTRERIRQIEVKAARKARRMQ